MAFDVNNPADLLALKNEVNLDPIGMGYDPTGPTQPLLKLLNDPSENIGGDTAEPARQIMFICWSRWSAPALIYRRIN